MSKSIALALATTILLCACNKEEPRPSFMQQDMMMERANFKLSSDDWEEFGTPGDDIHGYTASATVQIINQTILNNGVVQVHLQRSNGGWLELPATAAQGGPGGNNWTFTCTPGKVHVRIDKNGETVTPPSDPITLRVTTAPN